MKVCSRPVTSEKDNDFLIDEMPALGTGKRDMKQLKTIAAARIEAKSGLKGISRKGGSL